jgi:hypothetical protein
MSINKTSKIYKFFSLVLIINLIIGCLVLPYAQNTANSHMDAGPFIGTAFYFIAILLAILAFRIIIVKKDYVKFLFLLITSLSIFYWGYQLHHLLCLGCLNSG